MDLPNLSRLDNPNAPTEYTAENPFENPLENPQELESMPEIMPKTKEELDKEFGLRLILQFYKHEFPSELAMLNYNVHELESLNLDDLESLRQKCDMVLGGRSAIKGYISSGNAAVYTLEQIMTAMGIDIRGTTQVLMNDSDFQTGLKQLSLKYLDFNHCKPEITVPMRLITTAYSMYRLHGVEGTPQISKAPQAAAKSDPITTFNSVNNEFVDI